MGRLVLVGTPIGNLDDISPRAVRALTEVDVIYCEDTRRTRRLLSALNIPAPALARLDQHNEPEVAARLADAVEGGATVALVTDAGMPTISDPGRLAVKEAIGRGLPVDVVPGPSAVSAALALSGFEASQYRFLGFLARKGGDRSRQLSALAADYGTVVLYEAPHRVARTVADLARACGPDRPVVLARELTKIHQEVWRGPLDEAERWLASAESPPRGEWVVVLGPGLRAAAGAETTDEAILAALGSSAGKEAVARVAAELAVPKRRVYALAVAAKKPSGPHTSMP